jgi:hypothetical protein
MGFRTQLSFYRYMQLDLTEISGEINCCFLRKIK